MVIGWDSSGQSRLASHHVVQPQLLCLNLVARGNTENDVQVVNVRNETAQIVGLGLNTKSWLHTEGSPCASRGFNLLHTHQLLASEVI